MRRRTVLGLPLAGSLAWSLPAVLTACSEEAPVSDASRPGGPGESGGPGEQRVPYGDHPSQFGVLHLPAGREPRGVVVVIHGGFWRDLYDLSLGTPLARSLAAEGWAAWNLEYRRVGDGGGSPATLDDVGAGIDALADLPSVADLGTVVTLGHSAGGHLAAWAAGRDRGGRPTRSSARSSSGSPTRHVPVTHVIAQAGVLDLVGAHRAGLGAGAVEAFLGHAPGPADAAVDPLQQVPLDVPVWCVHGEADDIVPISQSQTYVEAARAAGAPAELVPVEGDHFVVIDPASEAWAATLAVLDGLDR